MAREIATALAADGHIAYFAGGCVRDHLRGEVPTDYDIATDATPATIRRIFPRAIGVGEAFGVMLVRRHGCSVEVATFRSDGPYGDRRRPDDVHFGTPEADAKRRDFTINGLFEDPTSGAVIDFVGGEEDLRRGVLRAIGDPIARLREDPLRALRAVRFAARFGFAVDPATAVAVSEAGGLDGVSRERVGQEIRRMVGHPSVEKALSLLQEFALDVPVLGEASCRAPLTRVRAVAHTPTILGSVPSVLAAWLLDRLDGHGGPGLSGLLDAADAVRQGIARWTERLVLSNTERDAMSAILLRCGPPLGVLGGATEPWESLRVAVRKRIASLSASAAALTILGATDGPAARRIGRDIERLAGLHGGLAPTPLVSGDDLVAAGLRPGPVFAEALRDTYDAQLEGEFDTPEGALRHALERARVG